VLFVTLLHSTSETCYSLEGYLNSFVTETSLVHWIKSN